MVHYGARIRNAEKVVTKYGKLKASAFRVVKINSREASTFLFSFQPNNQTYHPISPLNVFKWFAMSSIPWNVLNFPVEILMD